MLKKFLDKVVQSIPIVGKWRKTFLVHPNPGHFYSPVPDKKEAIFRITKNTKEHILQGIDVNEEQQIVCLNKIVEYYPEYQSFIKNDLTFFNPENIYYNNSDAISLFGILRTFSPKTIIEIGCGNSSALMIDIKNNFFGESLRLQFIDPHPKVFQDLTSGEYNHLIIDEKVQDVNMDIFSSLEKNDILFVDSSHVSKTGSDVNHIIFNILPSLKNGVIVHFHDVFYPFEYPKEWIEAGFYWNEAYLLKGFLMYNSAFEIIFMNSWVFNETEHKQKELFKTKKGRIHSGSIWIRKI